jgi:hypothetical protein
MMTGLAEPFRPGRRFSHPARLQRRTEAVLHERGLSLTRLPYPDNDPARLACARDMIDQASRDLAGAPVSIQAELTIDGVIHIPTESFELQHQHLGHPHPTSCDVVAARKSTRQSPGSRPGAG